MAPWCVDTQAFTLTLRLALVKLFDGLPLSHYTVLPHLDDDYVNVQVPIGGILRQSFQKLVC